ncbi:hypothetical protein DFH08DRAFT_813996 [Mycena albidolilacea]|uniref:Uncharacterized protein n=1 Tax=Mycena albidolilacea TaxID=1033008 RepID=A0AAD7EK82_9AGAR|nr:hypothetical protein DFH08DRAFT_813996 [Mycena albidolilacea]
MQDFLLQGNMGIGSLAAPGTFTEDLIDPSLDFGAEDVEHYRISAAAVGDWARAKSKRLGNHLTLYQSDLIAGRSPDVFCLPQYIEHWVFHSGNMSKIFRLQHTKRYDTPGSLLSHTSNAIEEISVFPVAVPFSIILDFLLASARRKSLPYEFITTQSIISGSFSTYMPLSRSLLQKLEYQFEIIVYDNIDCFKREEHYHWLDDIVAIICGYFNPADHEDPSLWLPLALIAYLHQCQSCSSIQIVVGWLLPISWNVVAQTILDGPSEIQRHPTPIDPVGGGPLPLMVALWHMYYYDGSNGHVKPSTWQAILDSISKHESKYNLSVMAMIKWAAWTCPIAGEQVFQFMSIRMVEARKTDSILRNFVQFTATAVFQFELLHCQCEDCSNQTVRTMHSLAAIRGEGWFKLKWFEPIKTV